MAQLRGVPVLNINELANSLKPVVLPGEIMKVFILKEGKEYNQGVAYLDDGTMVVVDNARKMISKTIDVVVTSVLQTTAGKMIFGRYHRAEPGGTGSGARSTAGRGRTPGAGAAATDVSRPRRHAVAAIRRPTSVARRIDARSGSRDFRPFHWWRTVFFLIPAIGVYTSCSAALSIGSSLFDRRGYFAHGARARGRG